MKRVSARVLFIGAGVAICTLMLHSCWVRIHAVEQFICTFDGALSSETQQQISASLSTQAGAKSHEIISSILERFPCVAHVGLHIQSNKDALIQIVAQTPLIRVNDAHVLTQSALLIPAHDFDAQALARLAHIQVAQDVLSEAHELQELQRHIKQIEPTILNEFNLMWYKSHEIVLTHSKNPHVQFICCAHQLADQKLIHTHVDQVAHLMLERTPSAASNKQWVADVRFENQVILRGPAMSNFGKNVTNGSKGGDSAWHVYIMKK